MSSAKWRPFCPGRDELTSMATLLLNLGHGWVITSHSFARKRLLIQALNWKCLWCDCLIMSILPYYRIHIRWVLHVLISRGWANQGNPGLSIWLGCLGKVVTHGDLLGSMLFYKTGLEENSPGWVRQTLILISVRRVCHVLEQVDKNSTNLNDQS